MKKIFIILFLILTTHAKSQGFNKSLKDSLSSIIHNVVDSGSKELNKYLVFFVKAEKDSINGNNMCFVVYQLLNSYEYEAAVDAEYYIMCEGLPILLLNKSVISNDVIEDIGFKPMHPAKHISFAQRLYPETLGGILSHSSYNFFCLNMIE